MLSTNKILKIAKEVRMKMIVQMVQHVTSGESKQVKQHSKLDYHFNNKDSGILSLEYEKMRSKNDDEGDDAFFTKKRPIEDGNTERTSRVYMNHLDLRQLIHVCPNTVNTNSSTLISRSSSEKRSKSVKAFHYNFMKVLKASRFMSPRQI